MFEKLDKFTAELLAPLVLADIDVNNPTDSRASKIVKDLLPKPIQEQHTELVVNACKKHFPVGSRVVYAYFGEAAKGEFSFSGTIKGYNEFTGGFYPGWRYPLVICRDDGKVFEYDAKQVILESDWIAGKREHNLEVIKVCLEAERVCF